MLELDDLLMLFDGIIIWPTWQLLVKELSIETINSEVFLLIKGSYVKQTHVRSLQEEFLVWTKSDEVPRISFKAPTVSTSNISIFHGFLLDFSLIW